MLTFYIDIITQKGFHAISSAPEKAKILLV